MKTEKIKQQLIQQPSKASYNTITAALSESGNSPKPFKLVLSNKAKDQDGTANAALATELSDFFISPRLNPKSTLAEIINGDIKALLAYDRETPLSDLIKLYFVDTLPQKLRALFAENELATMPIDSLPVDGAQTTLITPKQKADLDALGIPFETPYRQLPVALSVASAFSLVMPLMGKTAKITSIIAILASIITFSVIGLYYLRQLPTLPDAIRIENHVPAKQLLMQALTLGVTLLCGIASFQDSLQESNADRSLNVGLAVAIMSTIFANFNQLVLLLQQRTPFHSYHFMKQLMKKAILTLPGVFATVYTLGHIHEQDGDSSTTAITKKLAASFCIVSFSSDLISEVAHLAWEAIKYLVIRPASSLINACSSTSSTTESTATHV